MPRKDLFDVPRKRSKHVLKVCDLFCGCGGLSVGFEMDGYQIVAGIDHDAAALKTFSLNFPSATAIDLDLSNADQRKRVWKQLAESGVDVVVAGPPCQGFSLTGPRNFDDPRNSLYLAVFDLVREVRPAAFVIENVRGMASLYGGAICEEVVRRFARLGYTTSCEVLCAADYGVPQLRHRLFLVGLRNELGVFSFPCATHGPKSVRSYLTCREAIGDLPALNPPDFGTEESGYSTTSVSAYQRLMRGDSRVLFNHVATRHTEKVRSVIRLVPAGGDYRDLPSGVGEHRRFNEAWTRYHPDRPSYTIDTGHRNHFHYEFDRVPTIRENARLQSFPDRFRFLGTRTEQNRQVGNAVPPLLAKTIASALRCWI
jgi:DNA (cytosine-5)-methyltransferase 1